MAGSARNVYSSLALQNAQLQRNKAPVELLQDFLSLYVTESWHFYSPIQKWVLQSLPWEYSAGLPTMEGEIYLEAVQSLRRPIFPVSSSISTLLQAVHKNQSQSSSRLHQRMHKLWASRQLFLKFPPGVLRIRLHLGMLVFNGLIGQKHSWRFKFLRLFPF